jgi:hypothetical protein
MDCMRPVGRGLETRVLNGERAYFFKNKSVCQ